ncbi:MAG: hypothetical protein ACYCX5_02640 [Coriobacteriia bacterium]
MEGQGTGRVPLVVVGATLVIVGVALMVFQITGIDLLGMGWPMFVIIPGVAFLVPVVMMRAQSGLGYLAIPGCVITTTGLLLGYQNSTGDWQSWSYAWALVAPTSVGLGLLIAGTREGVAGVRRAGFIVGGIGLGLFVLAETVFVRVLNVGGAGLGRYGDYLLPVALMALGTYIAFGRRSWQQR